MKSWVSGVVQRGTRFEISIVNDEGVSSTCALSQYRRLFRPSLLRPVPVTFQASELSRGHSAEFEKLLGISGTPTEAHEVFALMVDKTLVLIPAIVLFFGLFGASKVFPNTAFSANGLKEVFALCGSQVPGESFSLSTFGFPSIKERYASDESVHRRAAWVLGFPSALAMYSSILENARVGRFDFKLPLANIGGFVRGYRKGDTLLATTFTAHSIQPTEAAFVSKYFSSNHTFHVNHAKRTSNKLGITLADPDFRDAPPKVSEIEWWLFEPLLRTKYHADDLRLIIDAIIEKLRTGRPWDRTYNGFDMKAETRFRVLTRNGRWNAFKTSLLEFRKIVNEQLGAEQMKFSRPMVLRDWGRALGMSLTLAHKIKPYLKTSTRIYVKDRITYVTVDSDFYHEVLKAKCSARAMSEIESVIEMHTSPFKRKHFIPNLEKLGFR